MLGTIGAEGWKARGCRFIREEKGQDLAEYGMLAALIAVVAIVAITALGGVLANLWSTITTTFAGLP